MQYQSNTLELKQYLFYGFACVEPTILYLPFSITLNDGNGILNEFMYNLN